MMMMMMMMMTTATMLVLLVVLLLLNLDRMLWLNYVLDHPSRASPLDGGPIGRAGGSHPGE
jgi:hypothetical protein